MGPFYNAGVATLFILKQVKNALEKQNQSESSSKKSKKSSSVNYQEKFFHLFQVIGVDPKILSKVDFSTQDFDYASFEKMPALEKGVYLSELQKKYPWTEKTNMTIADFLKQKKTSSPLKELEKDQPSTGIFCYFINGKSDENSKARFAWTDKPSAKSSKSNFTDFTIVSRNSAQYIISWNLSDKVPPNTSIRAIFPKLPENLVTGSCCIYGIKPLNSKHTTDVAKDKSYEDIPLASCFDNAQKVSSEKGPRKRTHSLQTNILENFIKSALKLPCGDSDSEEEVSSDKSNESSKA